MKFNDVLNEAYADVDDSNIQIDINRKMYKDFYNAVKSAENKDQKPKHRAFRLTKPTSADYNRIKDLGKKALNFMGSTSPTVRYN